MESLQLGDMCELATLDMTGMTGLRDFKCRLPALTSLDLTDCVALDWLEVHDAQSLTDVDLSYCYDTVTKLEIDNCGLDCVSLEDCFQLQKLTVKNCKLGSLDLASCEALLQLDCAGNRLTRLDVSACKLLAKLDCSVNPELAIV